MLWSVLEIRILLLHSRRYPLLFQEDKRNKFLQIAIYIMCKCNVSVRKYPYMTTFYYNWFKVRKLIQWFTVLVLHISARSKHNFITEKYYFGSFISMNEFFPWWMNTEWMTYESLGFGWFMRCYFDVDAVRMILLFWNDMLQIKILNLIHYKYQIF